MLLGHRKTNCKIEKVADTDDQTTIRGLECKASKLPWNNSYEKWVISTVTSLPTNAYWKLSSFLPPLQVVDHKNHFGYRALSSMDVIRSLSSPSAANYQVDKPTEDTDCVKLVPFNRSSGANISCQSQNRSKFAKRDNSSSSTHQSSSLVSATSSDSFNTLNADCSNFFLNDIPAIEDVVKRHRRTSRKKRGKQYKQTVQEKVSTKSDVQCNVNSYNAYSSKKSANSIYCNSCKKFFGNISDKAIPSGLSLENLSVDGLNDNEQDCASYIDDIDDSELVASSQKFASLKLKCNSISCQNIASTTTQVAEMIPSTFDVYVKDVHGIANINFHDNAKKVECSTREFSSSELQSDICKRGRITRKVAGGQSTNVANTFRPADSQGQGGKDKKRPVWKKRHKSDSEACFFQSNDISILSPREDEASDASKKSIKHDKILKMKEKTRRSCKFSFSDETNGTESCQVASNSVKPAQNHVKRTLDSSTIDFERRYMSASKHANHFSRSEDFTVKTYMPKVLKHHVHKKESLQTSQLAHQETTGLHSPNSAHSQHNQVDLVDCNHSKPAKGICAPGKVISPTNVCHMGYNGSSLAAHMEIDLSHEKLHYCSQKLNKVGYEICNSKYFMDMHEDLCDPATENNCIKLEYKTPYTESCSLQHANRTMQKNVSLWKKKSVVLDIGHDLALPVVGEEDDESDATGDELCLKSSFSKMKVSSAKFAPSTNQSSIYSQSAEAISNVDNLCNSPKVQNHELMTQEMHPVVNFERFICSASPTIGESCCDTICSEQLLGPLCWDQIPNISLKRLWHWYEESGCFGLEVKAEDHRILNNSTNEFNAYFVPYLSAVQLFENSITTNQYPIEESAVSSNVDKTSDILSNLESLPIFSKLFPQPKKENGGCFSKLLSPQPAPAEVVKTKIANNGKLIFEFFESDQPPCRRPLFEKISELVNNNLGGQIFGDPMKLESTNLHDLHPDSWFSVAWYPIYRIPYGKLRAAFLTYHSLGNFVHQHSSSCSPRVLTPIVCPVVGLLTYNDKIVLGLNKQDTHVIPDLITVSHVIPDRLTNENPVKILIPLQTSLTYIASLATISSGLLIDSMFFKKNSQFRGKKGENWFEVRDLNSKAIQSGEVVKERLRTLKQTASKMARAVVSKGDQKSVNHHPDHEFFVSRNW